MQNAHTFSEGMALVETSDGRWFPAFASLAEHPRWVLLIGESPIPAALEPLQGGEPGYACREEAMEAYRTWREAATLPVRWQKLAAQTEVYPERNAWYREEIAQLTGDIPMVTCGISTSAVVIAERDGISRVISATGASLDEAMETLYQRVYDFLYGEQEEVQRRAG